MTERTEVKTEAFMPKAARPLRTIILTMQNGTLSQLDKVRSCTFDRGASTLRIVQTIDTSKPESVDNTIYLNIGRESFTMWMDAPPTAAQEVVANVKK